MRRFARLGALVATSALAVSGVVTATAPSAQALLTPTPTAENAAAQWLASQLTTNGLFGGTCSYDCGNDIDAGISLIAAGTQASTVNTMKTNLPGHVLDYITGDGTGDPGSTYSGAVAKSLVFAEVAGLSTSSYGGVNLKTRLEDQVKSGGATDGRIYDTSTFGDFANTLGQAFAARGLTAASSGRAVSAQTFLIKQQCAAGYFRQDFSDLASANQSCTSADAPSIDATAIATTQLAAIASPSADVTAAITKARAWLASVQNCTGGFGSGDLGENANTTGLAATTLGQSVASQEAARWLNRHQAPTGVAPLAGDIGAIAVNDADFAAGKVSGITAGARGRWQRATAQATTGLADFSTGATPTIHLSAISGYQKAGSRVSFHVTGAEAGTVVCLGSSRAITSASGATLTAVLPAGTATRTLVAKDGYGNTANSPVKVLGAKTLTVHTNKAKVKKRKYVTVTVSGLLSGERASIKFRNVLKATGTANLNGKFIRSFKVGTRKGKAVVAAYGQFGDIRKGAHKIKVVK